jgi:glycosyltransferase involved in cell wall biosynthesis/O-antigen ligase
VAELPATTALPAPMQPRSSRLLAYAALGTIPLIAWSRDIAVATLIFASLGLLVWQKPQLGSARLWRSPAILCAFAFLAWSAAAVLWAPHLPLETWLKTATNIALGLSLAVVLAKQPRALIDRAAGTVLVSALALIALLAIERITGGFFVGLHRETQTVFQRLTTLSGGLVLLCTTCFACGLLLTRFVGALIAIPLWVCAVLAVSLGYPMDAEVVAILGGALVFIIVLMGGRAAAVVLMTLLVLGMLGWGFAAEQAAEAGLHRWLMTNVDPNWGYRVEIWRYVNELIHARLWQGYGFDASRVVGQSATLMPSFEGKTSFLHPHNGMLQLWLELGLVGVALFVAAIALAFKSYLTRNPNRMALATLSATVTTTAVIWSLSFGAWQGWWLAVLGLTASCLVIACRVQEPAGGSGKRLLFLVTEYYFFDALKKEITRGALDEGYDIFVAGRCRPDELAHENPGITIIPFDWKRSPSLLVSIAYFIPDLVRVGRLFNQVNPDVLHNIALKPSIIGSLAAIGRTIHVINAIHGFGYVFMSKAPGPRVVQAVCGLVLKLSARFNAALILLINRHDLAYVHERMGVPSQNLRLIHGTGIDLERFTPLPEPSGPFKFLVIGRLLYMKGTHIALEAQRILQERGVAAELIVCGSPDPENPSSIPQPILSEWAARPGVTFAGQVADVRPFLAACHILVHPSLGGEGLPRALTEGAASQRALVATEIPGNTEVVIPNQTGLLVPAGDAEALADAMEWMMAHEMERLAFARAGRAMIERDFSSAQVTRAHAALYEDGPVPRGIKSAPRLLSPPPAADIS